jgi:heptaprenyl diphosphate synthase
MTVRQDADGAAGADLALGLLQDELARVSAMLGALAQPGGSVLGGALPHLVNCGGKLLRPLLTLASGHAAGARPGSPEIDRCVRAAAAVELLHVGTLCHDDVMDDADVRRGAASVNAKWGNSTAILCGDVLIARAIVIVTALGPSSTEVLAQTLEDLSEGQALETATLFDGVRSRAAYLRTAELKTASLFAASCQLGALSAGLHRHATQRFAAFGRLIGVAFQIVDDVLDLVGSEEVLGKPPGSDLRAGVITLPFIEAAARAPQLPELLSRPLDAEQIAQARAIVLDSGGVDAALTEVSGYIAEARRVLSTVAGVDMRYVATLTELAESVLEQELVGAHDVPSEPLLRAIRRWHRGKNRNESAPSRPPVETPRGGRPIGGYQ